MALAAGICLACAPAALAAEPAPVVSKADMSQAYSVSYQNHGFIFDDGKEVGKANRAFASWDGNTVDVFYSASTAGLDANCAVTYRLQRSERAGGGFSDVGETSWASSGHLSDAKLPRGRTFYYRVAARYSYYGQPERDTETVSNVVSIKTSPKTLSISKAKIKTPKGWASKLTETKKTKALFKKGKSTTFRLSWKKRTDVDGYYVYRVTTQFIRIKSTKAWQYPTMDMVFGPGRLVNVTSSKLCKRVKTLKAGATSFTCKVSNKYVVKSPKYRYYYAVVPFIKQNGKVYLGECKKVFCPSYDYGINRPSIYLVGKDFKTLFPFPLR